ncbi:putative membrane protein [Candidatus Zixiibacteriota bacterium]|nr:putative membrane protein [candidate division Zixibacteria bacterium]
MIKFWNYVKGFVSHYLGGLYHRIDEHHALLLSGGLAFSLFVCIVPFVLIIFSILGNVLANEALTTQVNSMIERVVPYQVYSDFVQKFIAGRIEEFRHYKKIAGLIGVIGLMIAASGLFSSMRTILNRVFVPERGKFIIIGKLRDFGMVLLVMFFFLISTAILPILDILKHSAQKTEILKFLQFSQWENIVVIAVSYSFIFLGFFTLYSLIPYARLGWKVPALSALWAAFLWEAARQIFGYYILNIASLKQIYGTYMFIVVIATWIYYSSVVFVLGAEIGQLYRERLNLRSSGNG